MKNTRLYDLIATFSTKELRDCRKFVRSPFFNHREDVVALFDFLSLNIRKQQDAPTKAAAFEVIYKGEKYDDPRLRMVMSFLFKILEKYLIYQVNNKEEAAQKTLLASVYRQRKLPKHFERTLQEVEKIQTKHPHRNSDWYAREWAAAYEKYQQTATTQRTHALNLQTVSTNMDVAYCAQKLRQACLAKAHEAVFKTEYHLGLLPEIMQYVQSEKMLDIPAAAVYFYGYQIQTEKEDTTAFYALKKLLTEQANRFPVEEMRMLYLMAINYCTRFYNKGEKVFLREEFDLYKTGLAYGFLLSDGKISHFTYRNVVTIGLILQDYTWTEQFIFKYKSLLHEAQRAATFSYSFARLCYERGQFDKALELLRNADFTEVLPSLSARTLMLKIFFEQKEYDLLEAHLQAMRTFIRRKKVIGYHRENYIHLIQFTRKILELIGYDKAGKKALLKEIEGTSAVAEKKWLLGLLLGGGVK